MIGTVEDFPKVFGRSVRGHVTGPRFDMAAIVSLLWEAGATIDELCVMAAIAMAETGYESKRSAKWWAYSGAVGDSNRTSATWGPSTGLWQHRWRKDLPAPATEPLAQAREALALLRGEVPKTVPGYQHWTTWKKGKHKVHLQSARVEAVAMFTVLVNRQVG